MPTGDERGTTLALFCYVSLLLVHTHPGAYRDSLMYFRNKLEKRLETA